MAGPNGDRGRVELNCDECKGCALCVEACPPKVLLLSPSLNRFGYHTSTYTGHGCTGCGICFYVCPEPGGIRVLRAVVAKATQGQDAKATPGEAATPPPGKTTPASVEAA